MSYDLYLEIDTGGPEPAGVADFNMTSNVAPMWRKAGADLAEFDGVPAGDTIAVLTEAIAAIEADWATYEAMNPENGWGSAIGCHQFLQDLLSAAQRHPRAVWSVSR